MDDFLEVAVVVDAKVQVLGRFVLMRLVVTSMLGLLGLSVKTKVQTSSSFKVFTLVFNRRTPAVEKHKHKILSSSKLMENSSSGSYFPNIEK